MSRARPASWNSEKNLDFLVAKVTNEVDLDALIEGDVNL